MHVVHLSKIKIMVHLSTRNEGQAFDSRTDYLAEMANAKIWI